MMQTATATTELSERPSLMTWVLQCLSEDGAVGSIEPQSLRMSVRGILERVKNGFANGVTITQYQADLLMKAVDLSDIGNRKTGAPFADELGEVLEGLHRYGLIRENTATIVNTKRFGIE